MSEEFDPAMDVPEQYPIMWSNQVHRDVGLMCVADPDTLAYLHVKTVFPWNFLKAPWANALVVVPDDHVVPEGGVGTVEDSVILDATVVAFELVDIEQAFALALQLGNVYDPQDFAEQLAKAKRLAELEECA